MKRTPQDLEQELRGRLPAVHATVDELVALFREERLVDVFDRLKALDPAELTLVVLWLLAHLNVCETLHTPAAPDPLLALELVPQ